MTPKDPFWRGLSGTNSGGPFAPGRFCLLPKNVFGPPTYDTFPPPLFWRLSVISLKRKRHRPAQPQLLKPPKVVLESTFCSTFPPQIHVICFAPPPLSCCPSLRQAASSRLSFLLQNSWTPEGFLKGVSEGVSEGVSRRTLQNPFRVPSRTLRKPSQESGRA